MGETKSKFDEFFEKRSSSFKDKCFKKNSKMEDASNEFEKEMELELESRIQAAETSGGIRQNSRVEDSSPSQSKQKKSENDFWESDEDEYFDEWDNQKKCQR